MIHILRTGDTIGDHSMTAHFVQTLNDNDIQASYGAIHHRELFNVPVSPFPSSNQEPTFYFDYTLNDDPHNPTFDRERTIFEIVSDKFRRRFMYEGEMLIKTPWVPVKFDFEKHAPTDFKVVLQTKSGVWSKWRNWGGFPELKKRLDAENISWVDVTEKNIQNQDLLNCVRSAKVYVGLESGPSHYVSKFAFGKGIILQSGYSWDKYWGEAYGYRWLSNPVECQRCFIHLKNGNRCHYEHRCMTGITVEKVMEAIRSKL